MPLLLAFETATDETSVALLEGDSLIGEECAPEGARAAEALLPALDTLLARTGAALCDVAAFAVSIGPGSFTGLRVGLATAKGLAFTGSRPLIPVPTLAALAAAAPRRDLPVVPLLDARRGEIYAGVFDASGEIPRETTAVGVYTPEQLAALLPAQCLFVGDGVGLFGEGLTAAVGPGASASPLPARAAAVGRLGAALWAAGEGADAALAVPRYVRRADAEVKRTGVRFEPAESPGPARRRPGGSL